MLKNTWILMIILVIGIGFTLAKTSEKVIKPTPGYILAKNLPQEFKGKIISIKYQIYDAFDGSTAYTSSEKWLFNLGNRLHIESTPKTIGRRLLFNTGDSVSRDRILETERNLRTELFLADALIEVDTSIAEGVALVVHTFDQWTTTPSINIAAPGGEWVYWGGLIESNLLGTGQQIGALYSKDLTRETVWGMYGNNAFLAPNLRLQATGGHSSDGYFYTTTLSRPFISKDQTWGFQFTSKAIKQTKFYYLSADRLQEADPLIQSVAEKDSNFYLDQDSLSKFNRKNYQLDPYTSNEFITYPGIMDLTNTFSLTRSFGIKNKVDVSWETDVLESYPDQGTRAKFYLGEGKNKRSYPEDPSRLGYDLDLRKDIRTGFRLSYYQKQYKTVANFRNLKWQEDIDVGFRVSQKIALNLGFLGSTREGISIQNSLGYTNIWQSAHFFTFGLNSAYDVIASGITDGTMRGLLEYQWKPIPTYSSYFFSAWDHGFAQEKSMQYILGGEEGFNGYPNRFFAGQARLQFTLEQRYFPQFEFATAVPALALFLNGGKTWESYQDADLSNLYYSAGFGLRIGAVRSVQKIVQHLNVAFPLEPKYRENLGWYGMQLSLRATLNL